MDRVDRILAQWHRERPDLDVSAMGLLGRLSRLSTHVAREIEKSFSERGLSASSFDVLATLRRSGAPYRLSPGTMTNRIDQLEKAGLVERIANPEDRRSVIIALTEEGLRRVDEAATAQVANQHRVVSELSPEERAALDGLLRKYLAAFE